MKVGKDICVLYKWRVDVGEYVESDGEVRIANRMRHTSYSAFPTPKIDSSTCERCSVNGGLLGWYPRAPLEK